MEANLREEVAASVGARRGLGPDYDEAIAESLVERIDSEIDRRIEERLRDHPAPPPLRRSPWAGVAMGLGSLLLGIGASAIVLNAGTSITTTGITVHAPGDPQFGLVALIWVVVGAVNVGWAHRH